MVALHIRTPAAPEQTPSTIAKAMVSLTLTAIGDEYTVAFIGQALGGAYTRMGDFQRAKRYLDVALEY